MGGESSSGSSGGNSSGGIFNCRGPQRPFERRNALGYNDSVSIRHANLDVYTRTFFTFLEGSYEGFTNT